jgi:iodotyrosine deiodinase
MSQPIPSNFTAFSHPPSKSDSEMVESAIAFRDQLRKRRSIRDFSNQSVPDELIDACLEAASTAPSGANRQPWHFVVIRDPETKSKVRAAAEKEEKEFYNGRAPQEWLDALAHIGTDEKKEFLETAPVLIAIFAKNYDFDETGNKIKNYYVQESVGIATGMLITALHLSGLSTLTHTPSPMNFLAQVLDRPVNERAYILLVAGFAADDAEVPVLTKKKLDEFRTSK